MWKKHSASQIPFPTGAHLSRRHSRAFQCLAWACAGNKLALVAWETQQILSSNPDGGRWGDIGAFPSEWGCCVLPLEPEPFRLASGGARAEGRGLTVMSWTQWSAEVPWTHRREGWILTLWKASLMSLHFCCSGSEAVHHRTSILPSAGGRRQ